MSRTVIVVGGSVGLSALLAERLNVSIVDARSVPVITGAGHEEARDLAALLLAVTPRIAEPKEPMPFYRESGKQKAQWKRERAGRKS